VDKTKKNRETQIKNVLTKVMSGLKEREKEELDFIKTWEKAAGKQAAKHTRVRFLKAKRLVVSVSDSSWLYKLTVEKRGIIRKINDTLKGKKKITELQFRIGDI